MSFSVGTVFSGHSLTLKVLVSGSISQREKSVSRSPLLSIFRYPVTPRCVEKSGCVLGTRKEVQGLPPTSSPSPDCLCLALLTHIYGMITKGTDTSAAGMIGAGRSGLLDGAREMGQEGLEKAAEVSCGREEKTGVTSSAARLEAS